MLLQLDIGVSEDDIVVNYTSFTRLFLIMLRLNLLARLLILLEYVVLQACVIGFDYWLLQLIISHCLLFYLFKQLFYFFGLRLCEGELFSGAAAQPILIDKFL